MIDGICSLNSSDHSEQTLKVKSAAFLQESLHEAQKELNGLKGEDKLLWGATKFGSKFVATTSFGIQSAVLLHMLHKNQVSSNVRIIWIDTGYLPPETYHYADQLRELLKLNLKVVQSEISPARMEAIHGQLWKTDKVEDLEKYHLIRKITPLENALKDMEVECWASGVRKNQTNNRNSMNCLDLIRERLALRPLLEWTNKDIYYYMKENNLPQHPLFEKGYTTVGDWHSSSADTHKSKGRDTRFGGLKEECGIHLPGLLGEGI